MRVTLVLCAVGALAIAVLPFSPGLRVDGFRNGVKDLVTRVETRVLGYEPLP